MGKENFKKIGAQLTSYVLAPLILTNTGFARLPNREMPNGENLKISSYHCGFEDANTLFVAAETTGWEGVGITLKVTFIDPRETDPDKREIIIKELGVPKFNKEDRPRYDMTGYEDGRYKLRIEAKKGDKWNIFGKYDEVETDFYFLHCKE
jgi:hypothetical protein